jgi:hypothetical protein
MASHLGVAAHHRVTDSDGAVWGLIWRGQVDQRFHDFARNLLVKRRPCNAVGGRIFEGTSRCCALSIALSRSAAMTNLARSSHSLMLRALFFGGTKRSTLVTIFMVYPR